jgi:hypothetical protein
MRRKSIPGYAIWNTNTEEWLYSGPYFEPMRTHELIAFRERFSKNVRKRSA